MSQICSLICLLSMEIILAPNSTPIVRSCTGWKRLSVNCKSRHDLPTPVSPMIMYLKRKAYDIAAAPPLCRPLRLALWLCCCWECSCSWLLGTSTTMRFVIVRRHDLHRHQYADSKGRR